MSHSDKRPREVDDGEGGAGSGKAPRRESGSGASHRAVLEGQLDVDVFIAQLEACGSQLEAALRKIKEDKATIASLRAEKDQLAQRLAQQQQQAVAEHSGAARPRKQADSSSRANCNSNVICLDSDDEQAPMELEEPERSHGEGSSRRQQRADCAEGSDRPGAGGCAEKCAAESAAAAGDDELVFVSTSGTLGGDLPHPRVLCPKHPFRASDIEGISAETETYNSHSCDVCYCFLCDVSSKECKRWSGSKWLSHCNAHAGSKLCKQVCQSPPIPVAPHKHNPHLAQCTHTRTRARTHTLKHAHTICGIRDSTHYLTASTDGCATGVGAASCGRS
jgi:hypothetical protein